MMAEVSFRRRYYNNAYVGVVFLVLATINLFSNNSDKLVTIGLATIGTLIIVQTMMLRLKFTDNAVIISGLYPRKINYADISKIESGKTWAKTGGGSGDMTTINLISKQGKKLKLVPYTFAGYEDENGWASLLLKIVEDNEIDLDPKIQQSLSKAVQSAQFRPRFR